MILLALFLGLCYATPRWPNQFSMWQWGSPMQLPNTTHFGKNVFNSVWHYDADNKQLLLRLLSPNSTSYVLHKGNTSPAKMYFFDTALKKCSGIDLPIGPPSPNWLDGFNATHITDLFLKLNNGTFIKTEYWCKPDLPDYPPFCSWWDGNTILRLTAPPGGPGVPDSPRLILNEFTNHIFGPQDPDLFLVPSFCSTEITEPMTLLNELKNLPYPYDPETIASAVRASQRIPRTNYKSSSTLGMSNVLNRYLSALPVNTVPCEKWDLKKLNEVGRTILDKSTPLYQELYDKRRDPRKLRVVNSSYIEHWSETELLKIHEGNPDVYTHKLVSLVRDGKCTEIVMWYTHHLEANKRNGLLNELPLLPENGQLEFPEPPAGHGTNHFVHHLKKQYVQQFVCFNCHLQPGP